MKIQRPGHTESNLLYSNFLKIHYPEFYDLNIEHTFIGWLYSTCGVYDKSVDLNNKKAIIDSKNYQRWLVEYSDALQGSEHIEFCIGNPSFSDEPPEQFYEYINSTFESKSKSLNLKSLNKDQNENNWNSYWALEYRDNDKYHGVFHKQYHILKDKKVLVISPFAELVEYQYKNSVHQIFHNFPTFELITYTTPYTFLNDGPHDNFFQTLDNIFNDIAQINFDIALLSCGSYAALLIEKISSLMKKDAIYMGRGGNCMFGIDPQRDSNKPHELWMTKIPERLIYKYANKIEDGVYWKSK